jgi:hypothetical protein
MPEPVSTLGICCAAGFTLLSSYARGRNAVSEEANSAQKAANELVVSIERSQALFGEKSAAISRLRALENECFLESRDGGETVSLNPVAVRIAENFVRALPEGTPMPEFAAEPDGSVTLDWMESKSRLFSVSIGTGNRIAFAWLDGSDKGHGVSHFDGNSVPLRIIEGIHSIINHGNSWLRAA